MAITTKELSTQLEEVTARLRAIESSQHVMTSSPGLPLDKWNDHGFVHRHEIKPLVRAINNGGGSAGELEERVEYLESGQNVLTSVTNQQAYEIEILESGQAVLTSAIRNKQDILTAGSGIDITENVISATGGGGGSSIYDAFMSKVAAGTTTTTSEKIGEDSNFNYYFMGYHASSRNITAPSIERINVALAQIPEVTITNPVIVYYTGYVTRSGNRTLMGGPSAPTGAIDTSSVIVTAQSVTADTNGIYLNFSVNSKLGTDTGIVAVSDIDFFLLVADPKTT